MIKAVVFDIGGVLITDPKFKEFWGDSKGTSMLRKKFGSDKISFDEFAVKSSRILDLNKADFIKKFKYTYSHSMRLKNDVFRIYNKIKLDKYILSDVNPYQLKYLKKNFGYVFKLAKKAFFSTEIKMRKSELKTFKFLIKRINKKPEEILFIDNMERNLKNAGKLGINVILFKNSRQLIKDLRKHKIEI